MVFHSSSENVVSNVAPLSKVVTIDGPFVLGEIALPGFAFVESTYKAVLDKKGKFKESLKAETEAARYKGIDPMFRALAERELALESARLQGINVPDLPGPSMYRRGTSYYNARIDGDYDDGISSLLLGYTTQATGNPSLDIGRITDEVGPLLPNGVVRGAQLFRAGRDAGTAIHEYLTEQRMLNQRRFRGLSD